MTNRHRDLLSQLNNLDDWLQTANTLSVKVNETFQEFYAFNKMLITAAILKEIEKEFSRDLKSRMEAESTKPINYSHRPKATVKTKLPPNPLGIISIEVVNQMKAQFD
jgi:hypothetical protein